MAENEILVVASKVKAYVKDKGGLNTSASVLDVLSEKVRGIIDQAIEKAKSDGRKTLKDRDIE